MNSDAAMLDSEIASEISSIVAENDNKRNDDEGDGPTMPPSNRNKNRVGVADLDEEIKDDLSSVDNELLTTGKRLSSSIHRYHNRSELDSPHS